MLDPSGPVRGWRAWRVDRTTDGAILRGVVDPSPWPIGLPATAACIPGCTTVPDAHCTCGIYATSNLDEALRYTAGLPGSNGIVAFGEVDLWGTIVEGERGWRATHAYPHRLVLPAGRPGAAARRLSLGVRLCDYGVPVHVIDVPRLAVTGACRISEDELGARIACDIARSAAP